MGDDNEMNGLLAGLRATVLRYHIENEGLKEIIKHKDNAVELLVKTIERLVETTEKIKELHDG